MSNRRPCVGSIKAGLSLFLAIQPRLSLSSTDHQLIFNRNLQDFMTTTYNVLVNSFCTLAFSSCLDLRVLASTS
jgi:hypothetical protein